MNRIAKPLVLAVIILGTAAAATRAIPAKQNSGAPQAKPERARIAFSHPLPPMKGENLRAVLVEVNYGPGESSLPHTHPCPVIAYVLEGALRTQVKGEPEAVYNAGESFYEPPNGIHLVSANAGKKDSAKLLAIFVCDTNANLSSPVPASKSSGVN